MIRLICALCVMALLTGCGAGSIKELQDSPAAKYEFDAPMSYGATYGRVAYAARNCFQSAGPAASWYVEADLFANENRGEVTISLTNFGKRYYGMILIVPKEELTAHVTIWTVDPGWQHLGPDAERWANGDSSCKPQS